MVGRSGDFSFQFNLILKEIVLKFGCLNLTTKSKTLNLYNISFGKVRASLRITILWFRKISYYCAAVALTI